MCVCRCRTHFSRRSNDCRCPVSLSRCYDLSRSYSVESTKHASIVLTAPKERKRCTGLYNIKASGSGALDLSLENRVCNNSFRKIRADSAIAQSASTATKSFVDPNQVPSTHWYSHSLAIAHISNLYCYKRLQTPSLSCKRRDRSRLNVKTPKFDGSFWRKCVLLSFPWAPDSFLLHVL